MARQIRVQSPDVLIVTGKERKEIVAVSTVLITATASQDPLIEGTWLQPGQHITAIGADDRSKRELDGVCLRRANILIADSRPLNDQSDDVAYALIHVRSCKRMFTESLGNSSREISG